MEVVTDFPCLERGSFDLAYLTEVDPLWNDDELTLILLNPDAVLFANPIADRGLRRGLRGVDGRLRHELALLVRRLPGRHLPA